jgi:hypothetical protein
MLSSVDARALIAALLKLEDTLRGHPGRSGPMTYEEALDDAAKLQDLAFDHWTRVKVRGPG